MTWRTGSSSADAASVPVPMQEEGTEWLVGWLSVAGLRRPWLRANLVVGGLANGVPDQPDLLEHRPWDL